MIRAGAWDDNRDCYAENGTDFTVVLKRSRLYRSIKQTPIHCCGEQDARANSEYLIDNATCRGRKVISGRHGG